MQKLFSIAGRVAIVTGGGRGLGHHIAKTFVENGAKVYITSRSAETCERAAKRLTEAGPGRCIALPEDLSSEAGCKRLAERFAEAEGGSDPQLHVLVNNSGIAWGAPLESYPEAQWDRVMALNVKTPFLLSRALRPMLAKGATASPGNPSRIINIGSVVGVTPQPFPTYAYDVSKAAVHHLTRKLSSELAPAITVNAIAPGFVPSRMSRGLQAYVSEADVAKAIPMGRWGAEADIGGAAMFLASPAASWITGHVLVVDGCL